MRAFKTLCKDAKTGMEMILSETSFNMACDYLSRIPGLGLLLGTEKAENNMTNIYFEKRVFAYDEDRGYLLGA